MAVSCAVFEIDVGQRTPLYLAFTIPKKPFEFLPKISIQTVRVSELLGSAKKMPKNSSLCLGCNNVYIWQINISKAESPDCLV